MKSQSANALELHWLTRWLCFLIHAMLKIRGAKGGESAGGKKKHKPDVIFYTKDTDNRISAPAISFSRSLQITCPSERAWGMQTRAAPGLPRATLIVIFVIRSIRARFICCAVIVLQICSHILRAPVCTGVSSPAVHSTGASKDTAAHGRLPCIDALMGGNGEKGAGR